MRRHLKDGKELLGRFSSRGNSLLKDYEVGGRQVDLRHSKKASVAEVQSMKERG